MFRRLAAAAAALVLVLSTMWTPTHAQFAFDGEKFLKEAGADPSQGDVIIQVVNPDNGSPYATWSYKGRELSFVVPDGTVVANLPSGKPIFPGEQVLSSNFVIDADEIPAVSLKQAIPTAFNGERFLIEAGADPSQGDVIVQVFNPDNGQLYNTWSYKGQQLTFVVPDGTGVALLPSGKPAFPGESVTSGEFILDTAD